MKKRQYLKKQLTDVIFKKESPVKVAALWAKDDCQFILDWFGHFVSQLIYFVSLRESFPEIEKQYPYLNKLATRDLFCFLDGINKVRHQAFGSYNTQMIFEAFLVDWSESLHSCNRDNADLNSLPSNIFKL